MKINVELIEEYEIKIEYLDNVISKEEAINKLRKIGHKVYTAKRLIAEWSRNVE